MYCNLPYLTLKDCNFLRSITFRPLNWSLWWSIRFWPPKRGIQPGPHCIAACLCPNESFTMLVYCVAQTRSILVRRSHGSWNYKSKDFLLSSVSQLTHTPLFSSSSRYVFSSGHKRLTAMCLVIFLMANLSLLRRGYSCHGIY